MTFLQRHPAARWIAPAVAVGAVVGAQTIGNTANAAPDLPDRTPKQLVEAVLTAKVTGFSGTVESTADLGLPALPEGMTSSPSAGSGLAGIPMTLLSGTHTMSVWAADGVGSRVAVRARQAETTIVTNRTDAWVWTSADRTAAHADLTKAAKDAKAHHRGKGMPKHAHGKAHAHHDGRSYTPQQVAAKALENLGPSTVITTTDDTTVAGRPAYDLVLTPKAATTKVGSVHIAVDAKTSMPLRVEIFAKGAANPALEVGFTDISYSVPAASTFTFTPPAGAKVTELGDHKDAEHGSKHGAEQAKPAVRAVGSDWSRVYVATLPKQARTAAKPQGKDAATGKDAAQLLTTLPVVSGAWGKGRLVDTALFSAVVTDDGRVAVGAVQPSSLYAALAAK